MVAELLVAARNAVQAFNAAFEEVAALRKKAQKLLHKLTAKYNVKFDGLSRVSHVTGQPGSTSRGVPRRRSAENRSAATARMAMPKRV
mgnify:CR=1 FL=1